MKTLLQVRPILAALKSHKAAVTLLVLEIALTMAVLGNLIFVVYSGIQRSNVPTGVAEDQIGVIQSIGVIGAQDSATIGDDMAALHAVPGVEDAAYGGPPLWYVSGTPVFRDAARQQRVASAYQFLGSQGLSQTLGLRVVQGRDFNDNDLPAPSAVFGDGKAVVVPALITQALSEKLYGNASPLGRMLYAGTLDIRVIGVLDHLRGQITGRASDDYSIVTEFHVGTEHFGGGFMIRAKPAQLRRTLRAAAAALGKTDPGHVQAKVFTFEDYRARYFRGDLATGRMLTGILLILVVVTTLGMIGLTSFWVQQRRRQIGMRRALGATRRDILHYFQVENFLIVTGGVLLGAVCTYALSLLLMHHFELPRLPFYYLPASAVMLWLLGQVAVLGPALRAAAVPPMVATRSV
ncbi:MAG TPA: FtsX-like permease family protein [Rhodanobacteraceae bacterium]|nr:FtsX-like permease family protein [Rhodanobacteraceae bacterium]